MMDDRFDETLAALAREHNRATETPRDEMWAAIAAARGTQREMPAETAPTVIALRRPPRVYWRWAGAASALAATLLIGIVIGRSSGRNATQSPVQSAAATTGARATPSAESTVTGSPATTVASAENSGNTEPPGQPPEGTQKPVERSARATATLASAAPRARAGGEESRVERESALPYRVATMQHLATTEMLLVSLRTDVRAGRSDTTIARWAGDLLGTTRMLKDSPAGSDPQLKQLLDDLELVLAQIARLPGARGQAADLSLIDDAVQRRQLMTRLRAITPGT